MHPADCGQEYSQPISGCQLEAMNVVDSWITRVRAAVWQPRCVLCGGLGQSALDLCAPCEADLPLNIRGCGICAQPVGGERHEESRVTLICGACLRRPPRYDATYCPYLYAYPLDHLVRGLKYHGAVAQGRVLSELLARAVQRMRGGTRPDILLPVPLGQRRFRERGYNQAIELGRYVEKRIGVPLRADVVIRTRETREQAALDRKERRKNIRGAFTVARDIPAHIAIIDDVITTGSTVNELARTLKRAGARRVEVWAIARAGK